MRARDGLIPRSAQAASYVWHLLISGRSRHLNPTKRRVGNAGLGAGMILLPAQDEEAFDAEELAPEDIEALDDADPEPEAVTYSGSDFDVDGLVRRLDRGDIVIPTFGHGDDQLMTSGFQRRFVWNRPQMDRFIESLLLGYPSRQSSWCNRLISVTSSSTGQQRLRTDLRATQRRWHSADATRDPHRSLCGSVHRLLRTSEYGPGLARPLRP